MCTKIACQHGEVPAISQFNNKHKLYIALSRLYDKLVQLARVQHSAGRHAGQPCDDHRRSRIIRAARHIAEEDPREERRKDNLHREEGGDERRRRVLVCKRLQAVIEGGGEDDRVAKARRAVRSPRRPNALARACTRAAQGRRSPRQPHTPLPPRPMAGSRLLRAGASVAADKARRRHIGSRAMRCRG